MMEISLLTKPITHKIQTKTLSLVFNPQKNERADVMLFDTKQTEPKFNEETKVFDGAGEYEVNDTPITGVALNGSGTAFAIEASGLRLAHLPTAAEELNDSQIEQLTPVDILMVSAADASADHLSRLVSALEPTIIIPIAASETTLAKLSAEFGVKPQKLNKYKISHKDLPPDSQNLVIIE